MAQMTYRQALHDTLREELLRNENVFLLGEEIGNFEGSYKITAGLLKEFGPRRVVDTPICENGFVGMATGAAMLGLHPIVEIMTINFIIPAMDEIVNHADQDLLHVWWPVSHPHGHSHARRRRPTACCHPFTEPGSLVCPRPWPQGCGSFHACRCAGDVAYSSERS